MSLPFDALLLEEDLSLDSLFKSPKDISALLLDMDHRVQSWESGRRDNVSIGRFVFRLQHIDSGLRAIGGAGSYVGISSVKPDLQGGRC